MRTCAHLGVVEGRMRAGSGRDARHDAEFTEYVTARAAALRRLAYLDPEG